MNNIYGRQYSVILTDASDYQGFVRSLKDLGISVELDDSFPSSIITAEYKSLTIFAIYCGIAFFVLGLYVILYSFKTIGILYSLGYSRGQSVFRVIRDQFFWPSTYAFLIASLTIVLITSIRNATNSILTLILCWIMVMAIVFVVYYFLLLGVGVTLTKFYITSRIIKNQKPSVIIVGISTITRLIIGVFMVNLIVNSMYTYQHLENYYVAPGHWEFLSEYVEFPVYTTRDRYYQVGISCKVLFEIENNRGGLLMSPNGALVSPPELLGSDYDMVVDPNHEYFWRNNGVKINSNYLNINPIYDLDGRPVDLSDDEYSDSLTLLVPEKYRSRESIILEDFVETYTFSYYADYDYYEYKQKDLPSPEYAERTVKIIYVQDNQQYMLLNPQYIIDKPYLIDPIGIVVNNVNYGGDTYLSIISLGDFKAYSPGGNADFSYFEDAVNTSLLDDSIFFCTSSYLSIQNLLESFRYDLAQLRVYIVLSIILLVSVSLINVATLIYMLRYEYSIRLMLGYNRLPRSKALLIYSLSFWTAFFAITIVFVGISNIITLMLFSMLMLAFDVIVVALWPSHRNVSQFMKGAQ